MASTTLMPAAPHALLHNVRWETYEALLEDLDEKAYRLVYDRGDLEIVTPSHRHEQWVHFASRMIEAATLELDIPIHGGRSTLFKRRDLQAGIEPDECYWVQTEPAMRGHLDHDPYVDPPPDLVLEGEKSRTIVPRLPILARLGVGEVWRYDGRRLVILRLDPDGQYREATASACFPWLPIDGFVGHLRRAGLTDETTWLRAFVAWVRDTIGADPQG